MSLAAYLPQDRLRALARGEPLPDRTIGSALFADISGFTPLTEKLTQTLGPRRGIEELTRQINAVYEALIAEVFHFGGSVIGFAGDAITCWFDAKDEELLSSFISPPPSALRAVTSAFALQSAMRQFPNLGLKVAVSTGPARRFVVGNPEIQYWDTLAGHTIARLATAEHLASRGEIVVDEATSHAIANQAQVSTWHTEESESFATLATLISPASVLPTPSLAHDLSPDELRPWVNRAVFVREQAGLGVFLTELRPTTPLFLRFMGIDFETDEAGTQLDRFLRQVQAVLQHFEGTLIQLTIGDKGSYLYAAFGAPVAHEDDSRRAVKAALELRHAAQSLPFLEPIQMSLTRGTMRTGAYGGLTRRTYGVLGNEVNLAARLMTLAVPGQILVSQRIFETTHADFTFETLPPVQVKGKVDPLAVFDVLHGLPMRALRLQEPVYALPMVGRKAQLQTLADKFELTLRGKSQIIGILGEAGMGKSRLLAEGIRLARQKGFIGYGGAGQADGLHTPYLAWKPIVAAFFDVNPSIPLSEQLKQIERKLGELVPTRVQSLPLLGLLLNLDIPDNAFTQHLEPKYRQSALRALLEDYLHAAAQEAPLLIVLEDLHWVDALSLNLLEEMAQGLRDRRICFVLAYRPKLHTSESPTRLEEMHNFTQLELSELTAAEAVQVLHAKLNQLYPMRSRVLPIQWMNRLTERAQGNPFYLEELLNYVHDRRLDPFNPIELETIDLPDSLHTLILSRLDQLSERERTTLSVASIIGRVFRTKWLTEYYPKLGTPSQVKATLDALEALDITPLDSPEPELIYLFKHIVTHEVTYESLPFTTRARLHEQLASYLETMADKSPSGAMSLLNPIAFHYGRSESKEKQREYFRKAGEAAQRAFANDAALEYYGKLLPLLKDRQERAEIHLKRGEVWLLMGVWDETERDFRAALDSARHAKAFKAHAQFALGKLNRLRGDYEPALAWLLQAKKGYSALKATTGLAQTLIEIGMVWWRKGEYAQARQPLNDGLALARETGDKLNTAQALNNLGNVAQSQGDSPGAQALYEESLALRRELGDKWGIAQALNNVGVAKIYADPGGAGVFFSESLALRRELGDKWGIGQALTNLGNVAYAQGNSVAARAMFIETLTFFREMGDKWGMAYTFFRLGLAALSKPDQVTEAREHILTSLRMRRETGEQVYQACSLIGVAGLAWREGKPHFAAQLLGAAASTLQELNAAVEMELKHFHTQTLTAVREQLGEVTFQAAWQEGSRWSLETAVTLALEMETEQHP